MIGSHVSGLGLRRQDTVGRMVSFRCGRQHHRMVSFRCGRQHHCIGAVRCNVLQCVTSVCCSVSHRGAVSCSVLQCVAMCYNVLQCVAVYGSVLHLAVTH